MLKGLQIKDRQGSKKLYRRIHKSIFKQKIEWNTKIKVKLLRIDNEERKRGSGFKRRANAIWDKEYPECVSTGLQTLRQCSNVSKRIAQC